MLIAIYLAAIVAANLLIAQFGPSVDLPVCFLFIGFDLTTRDALHERWQGRGLIWKMLLLIAAGGALSYAFNAAALSIAIASCLAFVASETTDFLVYSALHHHPKWVKMNGSNLASAAVDSFAFPALAFGWPVLWIIVLGEFLAKTAGGLLWSWVLTRRRFQPRLEIEALR